MTRSGRSLWRHSDFMRLWSAETISQLGTQVTMLALPLTAILALHASPFEVGALSSVESIPVSMSVGAIVAADFATAR